MANSKIIKYGYYNMAESYRVGWGTRVTFPSWRGQQGIIIIDKNYLGFFWNLSPDSFDITDVYGKRTEYNLSYAFNSDYTEISLITNNSNNHAITVIASKY